MKFKSLALAAASLRCDRSGSCAAAKPRSATWGYDADGDGQRGQAGRRFLRLCQRRLGQAHRDRRRPHLRRHRFRAQRPDRQGRPRDRRGHGEGLRRLRPDRPAGRRLLRQLDGRGGASRQRGTAPLEALSRPDRRGEGHAAIWSTCSRRRLSIRRSASASIPTSRTRPTMPFTPAKAASACRTATITCSRAPSMTPIARPIATT